MTGHIVVTGCAGFIGSHLTDRLLADGNTVVGIDSFEDYYPRAIKEANLEGALAHEAFTLHEARIMDIDMHAIFAGARCVYHLAAQAGVRASWGSSFEIYTRNNVLTTQQLLEACVAVEVPKVIYASSSSVYGNQDELPLREGMVPRPRSPYGVTKLAGEHLCCLYHANHGLDTVSLRFFTVYGPRQRPDMAFHRFMRDTLEGREIVMYGDGSQTRDFTYIADIVDGLVEAPQAPGGTVMNLGGGNRVRLLGAIEALGDIMGQRPRVAQSQAEAGDVRDTLAACELASTLIGFAPSTDLLHGLQLEFEWVASRAELLGITC